MMLQSLYEYAQANQLLEDTDYQERRIDLILKLDAKGRYLGLIDGGKQSLRVPRMAKRTVGISPGFIVDNAQYVLGLWEVPGAGAKPKDLAQAEKDKQRAPKCRAAFVELLESVPKWTSDAAFSALVNFERSLEKTLPSILQDRSREEWTGGENIAIQVDEEWLHDRPFVRAAWRAMRTEAPAAGENVRCLVTGAVAPPESKHPAIKRVPGTQQGETALVSFNAPAFTSMGLKQSANAGVSRSGAEGYTTALNHLLSASSGRRYRSGVGLGDNVVLVWTRQPTAEVESLLDLLDPRKDAEAGLAVVAAPFKGVEASASDDTDFYAVTIGGNAARVVVRDWYQARFGDVKEQVRRWFTDLELAGVQRPPALWMLVNALESPGSASVPPTLAAALGRAALFGNRVPVEVLRHALIRLRVPPKDNEQNLLRQRMALVKLTLTRTFNKEVSVALDEEKADVPYLLGRLFAVLERLQGVALGDINATIRDRYFGAASSTPAVVFPRLVKLATHHASKSGAAWLEAIEGRIFARLPAERFPQILSLEDQGLFAVGYYHQRESFFQKRNTTNTETEQEKV